MTKTVRKTRTRKAAAARRATGGARRQTKIAELRNSRAKDRAAAKSGGPKAGAARGMPATAGEAAREFPDAIYQDERRT
jgi:hypothetical protein